MIKKNILKKFALILFGFSNLFSMTDQEIKKNNKIYVLDPVQDAENLLRYIQTHYTKFLQLQKNKHHAKKYSSLPSFRSCISTNLINYDITLEKTRQEIQKQLFAKYNELYERFNQNKYVCANLIAIRSIIDEIFAESRSIRLL